MTDAEAELHSLRTELWDMIRGFGLNYPEQGKMSENARIIWAIGNTLRELEELKEKK